MTQTAMSSAIRDVAKRIRELREIAGYTQAEMARFTDLPKDTYRLYEEGGVDLPFSFIHKCALTFRVDILDLMEGDSARLSSYTVTRSGEGEITARETGIEIRSLAPMFRNKIAEPYFVRYAFDPKQQTRPIRTATHSGQEFDYVLSGELKVQIGLHIETLRPGDSIYYNSSSPHGMIATGGGDCLFMAVVLPGEGAAEIGAPETILPNSFEGAMICEEFVKPKEDEHGALQSIAFERLDTFNFAYDFLDVMAEKNGEKLALLHLDDQKRETRFTFEDIKRHANRTANYLRSLGVKKGDRVMLVLRRQYHFWFAMIALAKIGAIAIPATDQLLAKDYDYRFNAADVSCVLCTAHGVAAEEIEKSLPGCPTVKTLILCGGQREGWHCFDEEYTLFSGSLRRQKDAACGADDYIMFFTSGTTGYPKLVRHSHTYPLAHYVTAKYWQCARRDELHLTISDTGWGKALWGKLFGQWLCEAPVFVYDFDRFSAEDILPLFAAYNIKTFCAPPTMYRMFIKEDLSKYDLSSIRHATIAGEALNPEVFMKFREATGISIMEGFGQTESALLIGNLTGMTPKIGSMGKPTPLYDVDIVNAEGKPAANGETGEIVVRTDHGPECGLFTGYYGQDAALTRPQSMYHTGDTAWRDEDGYYWYVGRVDDLIKSSGYRIGPFEIESVIMELPYVLECGVSAAPDPVRGQVVKASVVLTRGKTPSDELAKEIQNYVKHRTAPYKYPRIVVFRDDLPKTISGKIKRALL